MLKWRKWIISAALLVACVESVVLWRRHQDEAVGYKRYVSEPLLGGTRYTFLYPARMQVFTQAPPGGGSSASFLSVADPLDAIFFQAPNSNDGCTDISIQVGGKNSETYGDGRDDTTDLYSHFRHISQPRSQNQFFLQHTNCDKEEQPFEREDEVFNKSFQILPPGSRVPSP